MRLAFLLLLAAFFAGSSQAQVSHLDAGLRKTLLALPPGKEFFKVRELPPGVLKAAGFKLAIPFPHYSDFRRALDGKALDDSMMDRNGK